MAMDELERAMLDTRVNPACSTRIFLHMMPELTAVPKQVVAEWKTVGVEYYTELISEEKHLNIPAQEIVFCRLHRDVCTVQFLSRFCYVV